MRQQRVARNERSDKGIECNGMANEETNHFCLTRYLQSKINDVSARWQDLLTGVPDLTMESPTRNPMAFWKWHSGHVELSLHSHSAAPRSAERQWIPLAPLG